MAPGIFRLRFLALAAVAALLFPAPSRAEEAGTAPAAVRPEKETNRLVDAAVARLAAKLGASGPEAAAETAPDKDASLAELKSAAAPRLVYHLDGAAPAERLAALRLLDGCWAAAARLPAIDRLGDSDPRVRQQAAEVVRKNVSRAQLCLVLPKFFEEKNYKLAVPVFELAEQKQPDLERFKKVIYIPDFHKVMERYLPRYYSPEMTPATLLLLDSPDQGARRAAVIGLLHQNAAAPETRARLAGLLRDPLPDLREAAAEYFLWHGTAEELPAIEKAVEAEKDPYVLAALRAASATIAARLLVKVNADPPADKDAGERPAPTDYREALLMLRAKPDLRSRELARELFRAKEPFEPINIYTGREPEGDSAGPRILRLRLTGRLFAFQNEGGSMEAERPAALPAARTLMPPVRDYFDPARRSFGLEMSDDPSQTFSNSVHVGDDVGWFRDQRTVVAIGDGVVRKVSHSTSWGHLVIVEHRLPGADAWCCSLYAHLSPAICVGPGEVVRKGQKIGSIGRSRTWENGGYWSHLHFGIHEGPYYNTHPAGEALDYALSDGTAVAGKVVEAKERTATVRVEHKGESVSFEVARECPWVCGYAGKQSFKEGRSGWADPQKFITGRLEPPEKPNAADAAKTAPAAAAATTATGGTPP